VKRYLLDSNALIQASQMHYAFDFCPAFWSWIDRENGGGKVYSVEKVAEELGRRKDQLSDWVWQRAEELFLPVDERVLASMTTVSKAVMSVPRYTTPAKLDFLDQADAFLIAHAHAHGDVVVTHEKGAPEGKKPKIPDVAWMVNVKTISPFEMLRRERARFVL
jgi:hypothetical protein